MKERKQIWIYPDKENGFLTLGYNGKRNIIYIRKSNNGKLFLHAGTYSADFMNEILDDRTLKYCFVKDIPNWKYTTKGKFFENHNMKNDSYIEVVQDEVVERLQKQLHEKGLWIGVLKSHLEECWEIIKIYAEHDYLTPEDFYMRDRLESYYRRAGLGRLEDAKNILKKWGVK